MEQYLETYGWHFSKAMCEWAVSGMKDRTGARVQKIDKESLRTLLQRHGIVLENDLGYDAVYAYCMARADYWGSSITDDAHLVKFVKDYLDDPDGYDGLPFTRFYADCVGRGNPIQWDDML